MNPANPPPTSPPPEEEIPSVELPESPKPDQESPPQTSPVKPASPDASLGGSPQAEKTGGEQPKEPKEPKATALSPGPKIIKSENNSSPQMATRKEISTTKRLQKGKVFNLIAAILLSLSLAGLIWVVNFLLRKLG